jgi:hypothetical protein
MQARCQIIEKKSTPGIRRGGSVCWRWRMGVVIGLLVCGTLLVEPFRAAGGNADDAEYRVKLAFLYNFTQFIEWPPEAFSNPAAPLIICVAGPNPFTGEMEQSVRRRTSSGHPIQIKSLQRNDDAKACQMLFVRSSQKAAASKILTALRGSNTVTVGETKHFATEGGLINLTLEENTLHFEVNLSAALQTRLKISSKLLSLATIVT